MPLLLKHAREPPSEADGTRILVDRLWPRGVSKTRLQLSEWRKDVAPSTELRRWYSHEHAKWPEFARRYAAELAASGEALASLSRLVQEEERRGRPVTLVFAARDGARSNAAVLRAALERGAAAAADAVAAEAAPTPRAKQPRRRKRRASSSEASEEAPQAAGK